MRKKSLADYEEKAKIVLAPYASLRKPCLVHPTKRDPLARKVYQLRHGAIASSSIFVCHRCDRTSCIEDTHHFLGTCKDNLQDCVSKGRMKRSADHIAALTASNLNRAPEQYIKMARSLVGRSLSDSHKKNISKSLRGALNPRYKKELHK